MTEPASAFDALLSVIALPVAVRFDVPDTDNAPVCVTAPVATDNRLPVTVCAPKLVAAACVVSPALLPLTAKEPSVVRSDAPASVRIAARFAEPLFKVMPVPAAVTVPVKALAKPSVIALPVAVRFVVPDTDNAPVCVTAPVATDNRLPVTLCAPKLVATACVVNPAPLLPLTDKEPSVVKSDAPASVNIAARFAAPLFKVMPVPAAVTVPLSAFAKSSVIALPVAVRFDVPDTDNAPVCVTAPPEITDNEPALVRPKLVVPNAPTPVVVVSNAPEVVIVGSVIVAALRVIAPAPDTSAPAPEILPVPVATPLAASFAASVIAPPLVVMPEFKRILLPA